MDFTSLDAIEFFIENKKHIRTYYQSKDDKIRESSFEDGHGWFTRGDGIVATNAKSKSPIAVTRWNVQNETRIRLYYLDKQYNICECQGSHASGVTAWASSVILQNGNVAPGSQLAVARPEKDDTKLQVFYQENRDANSKHPLRELQYAKRRHGRVGWEVCGPKILEARENSRLSAVSAREYKDVRLYYQGESGFLMESFWGNRIGRWEKTDSLPPYCLVPKAPISAVCWHTGDHADDSNLRIRVYTILESHRDQIQELSFQEGGWDTISNIVAQDVRIGATQPPEQQIEYPAVAVSRDTKADPYRPNCVFYQPGPNVIIVKSIAADDGNEYDMEAANVVTPEGIPKSRGTCTSRSVPVSPSATPTPSTGQPAGTGESAPDPSVTSSAPDPSVPVDFAALFPAEFAELQAFRAAPPPVVPPPITITVPGPVQYVDRPGPVQYVDRPGPVQYVDKVQYKTSPELADRIRGLKTSAHMQKLNCEGLSARSQTQTGLNHAIHHFDMISNGEYFDEEKGWKYRFDNI